MKGLTLPILLSLVVHGGGAVGLWALWLGGGVAPSPLTALVIELEALVVASAPPPFDPPALASWLASPPSPRGVARPAEAPDRVEAPSPAEALRPEALPPDPPQAPGASPARAAEALPASRPPAPPPEAPPTAVLASPPVAVAEPPSPIRLGGPPVAATVAPVTGPPALPAPPPPVERSDVLLASPAGGGTGAGPGPDPGPPSAAPLEGRSAVATPDFLTALAPAGTGGSAGSRETAVPAEYDGYVRALRLRIQDRLVYPWLAVRQRLGGVVELEIQVDRQGRLARARVVGGEAAGLLRDAALRAVRDATPLAFPPGVDGRPLTITLPVVFELR